MPCCRRRGVSPSCSSLCQAVTHRPDQVSACDQDLDNIFTCYEEGAANLPPPVLEVEAARVEDNGVLLKWRIGDDNITNIDHYEVFYKEVINYKDDDDVFKTQYQINSNIPMVKVDNLTTNKLYSFYVVSRNSMGTSLPSSILTLNITTASKIKSVGATSPPHGLEVGKSTSSSLELSWNPPAILHPEDQLTYKVYYKLVANDTHDDLQGQVQVQTVTRLSVTLSGLEAGSQYQVMVSCLASGVSKDEVESGLSEVISTWTKSLRPAFVQMRLFQEVTIQGSGGLPDTKVKRLVNTVEAGGSLTVQCLASGEPAPDLSLNINGVTMHTEKETLVMNTLIHNITRDIKFISCDADNGIGGGVEAIKMINVLRKPIVKAPLMTSVMEGETLKLECSVDANPAPKLGIFRDKNATQGVDYADTRIKISAFSSRDEPGKFILTMVVANVTEADGGQYWCHASNNLGENVTLLGVHVTEVNLDSNHVQCCSRANVSQECLGLCQSDQVTYQALTSHPQCLSQYSQILKCAMSEAEVDSADMLRCCWDQGVSHHWDGWCHDLRKQVVSKENDQCHHFF